MAVFEARINLTSVQYQQIFDQMVGQGLRPAVVSAYGAGGPPLFAAIFVPAGGYPFQAFNNLNTIGYQQTFDSLVSQGYRPSIVSGYDVGGEPLFAAIFEQGNGYPFQAFNILNSFEYQQTSDALVNQGYQPIFVNAYTVRGQPLFGAIFEQSAGPPVESFHNMTSLQYQQTFDLMASRGYRPRVISGYDGGGQPLFAAIFEQSAGGPFESFHNLSSGEYQQTFGTLTYQGYQPTLINGYVVNGQPWFAAIFQQF
jgi:hypothetical protein